MTLLNVTRRKWSPLMKESNGTVEVALLWDSTCGDVKIEPESMGLAQEKGARCQAQKDMPPRHLG